MLEDMIYRLSAAPASAKRLLAALFGFFVPLLLIFTIAVPLAETRAAKLQAVAEAEALHRWVHAHATALPASAFADETQPVAVTAPTSIGQLEASLVAAGLRQQVSRLSNRGSGAVDIFFESVDFADFIEWLESSSAGWGYQFTRLRVERTPTPGRVSAALELAPSQ